MATEQKNVVLEVYTNDDKSQTEQVLVRCEFVDPSLYEEDRVKIKNRIGQALNTVLPMETQINYRFLRPGRQPAVGYYRRQEVQPYNNAVASSIADTLAAKEEQAVKATTGTATVRTPKAK